MNVSEKELESRYSELDTEELLELVARGSLTEVALHIAKAELGKRGETDPVLADVPFEKAESAKLHAKGSLPKRFWRGEVTLGKSFWFGGVFPSGFLYKFFVTGDVFGFLGNVLSFCVIIVLAVGICRSAIQYKGPRGWAVAAILYFALIIFLPFASVFISVSPQDGHGTYEFHNGDKYVGVFKDGKKHGQGIYTSPSGIKYVGEFKNGEMYGQGTYTWADGDKYVGEWKGDEKHGQGTYTYASGEEYVGEWKGDKKHGQGTYTYASGEEYVGEWKGDIKHGQGTLTWPDGSKFVGESKEDRAWNGTHYDKDGNAIITFSEGVQKSVN